MACGHPCLDVFTSRDLGPWGGLWMHWGAAWWFTPWWFTGHWNYLPSSSRLTMISIFLTSPYFLKRLDNSASVTSSNNPPMCSLFSLDPISCNIYYKWVLPIGHLWWWYASGKQLSVTKVMIFLSDCYRLYISCKINKGKALNYQTDLSNWYQVYISCKNETIKGGPGSLLFFVHSPCSQCSRFVRKKGIFSGTAKKKLSKTYYFPGFFRFLPSKTQEFFPRFFCFWLVNY